MKFDCLLLDCPWKFANRHEKRLRKGKRDGPKTRFGVGASGRYNVMSTDLLASLPIAEVMADPSVVFSWGSNAMAEDALRCMEAWGFRVSTVAFQWIKLNVGRARWSPVQLSKVIFERGLIGFLDWARFFGVGNWSASNSEPCWLGVRGSPVLQRVDKSISSVVFGPVGKHSAKPPEVARRIVKMFGPDRRYLELFARMDSPGSAMPGWTATGFDYDGLDVFDALRGLASEEVPDELYTYRSITARGFARLPTEEPGAAPVGLLC